MNVYYCLADEFNRVIIPVKRGEENTDYVNASFIDVSVTAHIPFAVALRILSLFFPFFLLPSSSSVLITGVPAEGLLHGEPGSSAAHNGGLLEDDLGVEKLLHSHADRARRERAGWLARACS